MHPSRVTDRSQSYERLEFLGDSILGLLVARELFERYPGRGGREAVAAALGHRVPAELRSGGA